MKKVCIFSALFGVIGFGVGYFTSCKINNKKYLKKADLEIESVKKSLSKYYDDKIAELNKKQNESGEFSGVACAMEEPKPKVKKKTTKKDSKSKQEKNELIDTDSIDYDKLKEERDASKYIHHVREYKGEDVTPEEAEKIADTKPYIISPAEYAEGSYDTRTLYYFKDGFLADDDFNVIKDIKGYIGDKALDYFSTYETDVVYVRNEKYEVDYEILLDEREFKKVVPKGAVTTYPSDDE